MEILEGPTVETRPDIPSVGIRVVTPFRGMLGVRDELLAEVFEWARAAGLELDRWDVREGDKFACRYEAYLTDPSVEPRKKQWKSELAFKLEDESA
jgi:hypothetical protein